LEGEDGKETKGTRVIRVYLDSMHHVLLALMAYLYRAVAGDHQRCI
jgi:hypothetical protein